MCAIHEHVLSRVNIELSSYLGFGRTYQVYPGANGSAHIFFFF